MTHDKSYTASVIDAAMFDVLGLSCLYAQNLGLFTSGSLMASRLRAQALRPNSVDSTPMPDSLA